MIPTHLIIKRDLMAQMILMSGLEEINQMIGGNVTEKITPETYEKMNKEFEEDGLAFRINIPTQEEIDEWRKRGQEDSLG